MNKNEVKKKHPSYGMVGISRSNGGRSKLFGSAMGTHSSTMLLSIHSAEWGHNLNRDWYYADKELIEIELSPAQFAEMITSPNQGHGVPCTIRRHDNKIIEGPPDLDTEVDRVQESFSNDMDKLAKDLEKYSNMINAALSKPTTTKAERTEMIHAAKMLVQHVRSNIPFALTSFAEASDKVVTAAKAEIEATMMRNITVAGINALRAQSEEEDAPKQLADGDDVLEGNRA